MNATNVVVYPSMLPWWPGPFITCDFDLNDAKPGSRDLTVTNPDGGFGTLEKALTVQPAITAITPDNAGSGNANVPVTITGLNYKPGATVKLTMKDRAAINATNVVVTTHAYSAFITCDFDLTGATAHAWNVVVTNPDGSTVKLANAFTVNPRPYIDAYTPKSARTGTGLSVKLTGHNFSSSAKVKLIMAGKPDIVATNVRATTSYTVLTFNLALTGAATGKWTIVVTNPDGGRNDGVAFTVNP